MKSKLIYCLLLFWLFPLYVISQKGTIRFEHLSLDDGLSQNTIMSVYQDKNGYIWIGTFDGLNRYDGYDIKAFRKDINNPNSIPDNYINVVVEDSYRFLWVGTRSDGLCLYNKKDNTFRQFKNNDKRPGINDIKSIAEAAPGYLWIGTDKGLFLFSIFDKKFTLYKTSEGRDFANQRINQIKVDRHKNIYLATSEGFFVIDKNDKIVKTYISNYSTNFSSEFEVASPEINCFVEDKNGDFWLGTRNGLINLKYDMLGKQQDTKFYTKGGVPPYKIAGNHITTIIEDNSGILWIGTYKNGLVRLDPDTQENVSYVQEKSEQYSLSANSVSVIFQDRSNIIWIGTNLGGLNKWDKANEGIELYTQKTSKKNTLSSEKIRSIYQSKSGLFWIGTTDGGLNRWDAENDIYTQYLPKGKNTINSVHIRSIIEDKDGVFWIGTHDGGLNRFIPSQNKFEYITHNADKENSLPDNEVWKVFEDSRDRIWVGTWDGLAIMNNRKVEDINFTIFKNNSKNKYSLGSDKVTTIYEDSKKNIWIGTFGGGLNKFNESDSTFTVYQTKAENSKSIGSNRIYCIFEDRDGILWIGNKGCLNRFDVEKQEFERYTENNGLPNDVIMGILEDDEGNLWMSTNKGISKFDKKETFTNYDVKKGLQSNEFLVGAYFKDKTKKMYFGGINGFNAFYPENVKNNSEPPTVIISDFFLLNIVVHPSNDGVLKNHISKTKEINLAYNENTFSFKLLALHYTQPENNKYKYILEGFDSDWRIDDDNIRVASYTNLSPGDYTFKVIGANSDGVWNTEPVEIAITITPPIWGTLWFRLVAILTAASLAYGFYRSRINRIERQKANLEIQVKERTAEVVEQKKELIKQAEELEKLSIVASETDNAVMIMDKKGDFLWINEGFTRMFGYNYQQLITEVSKNIIGPNTTKRVRTLINTCFLNKQPITYELLTQKRSGDKIWVQSTLTPIINKEGKISKFIAIDSDIHNIKMAEKEITEQNKKIQKQNEHIKGSIRYAQTIQNAILPMEKKLSAFFSNFVIYMPKDIVSGDFYWLSVINPDEIVVDNILDEKANPIEHDFQINDQIVTIPDYAKLFLVVADCTGHGVPGAFMSMIGNRLLSEIVNEKRILEPNKILEMLDINVKSALHQAQTDNNDGMDVCLCMFEKLDNQKVKLTYSGAKRSLFYLTQSSNEVQIIQGDRRSIGGVRTKRSKIDFSNKVVELHKNDQVYLTTDGIIDQHAINRKRFGTKRLINLIEANAKYTLVEQKEKIRKAIEAYKKNEEQRDDITIIGVRI